MHATYRRFSQSSPPHSQLTTLRLSRIPRHTGTAKYPALCYVAALLSIVLVAACDDPSSAGLELVDDQGSRPVVIVEAASGADQEAVRDETGALSRILVGEAADPLTGTVRARGFLDFSEPVNPTSAFRNGPVTSVTLVLPINYVHGDSVSAGSLVLADMPEEWVSAGVPADSSIDVGSDVANIPFSPEDGTISAELPSTWLDANEAMLRSAGSDTLFHGFALSTTGIGAVVGLEVENIVLRVVSGGETLDFPVNRILTLTERVTDAALPAGTLLVQDTAGPGVALTFDLTDNDLATAVINRSVIRLTIDTLVVAQNVPANFARTPAVRLQLQAVTTSGSLIDVDNQLIRDGAVTFSSDLIRAAMQGLAEDVGSVDHFRVIVEEEEAGIGVAVVNGLTLAGGPEAEIIFSKIQ